MEAEKKIPPGPHRLVERGILSHISNMNFQFWSAVLGSWGCREKKIQTSKSMLLLKTVLYVFMGKKKSLSFFKNIVKVGKSLKPFLQ